MRNLKKGLVLFFSMMLMMVPGNIVHAAESTEESLVTEDGFVYEVEEDASVADGYSVKIIGSTKAASKLEIPSAIDGYPVTVIGKAAFAQNPITELVIPDSVVEIKRDAFQNCAVLTSVKLSNSLEKMGESAFGNCLGLTDITIPKSLVDGGKYEFSSDTILASSWGAFKGCSNLKNVTFQEGTTIIAEDLFANCDGLERIVIPSTVEEIAPYAFYHCVNLSEVVFSQEAQLTEISSYAFEGCDSLETMVLPDSVAELGTYTFGECSNLKNVTLSNVVTIGGGVFYNCDSLEEIEIPNTLTKTNSVTIGATNAKFIFTECDNLKKVTFEEGTTEIADGLFYKCENLESIELPDTITLIGAKAFYNCSSLKEVKLPAQLQKIESEAFSNCAVLKSLIIPETVTKISQKCFDGIEGFTIYGLTGSYAEEYANTCSIPFVSIGTVTHAGFGEEDVYRIAGKTRYETSLKIAAVLKEQQKVEKFDTMIIANGRNFPDALAGSYLAGKLDAPILMANEKAQYADPLRAYIQENLAEGGTIYVLGGTGAVPESVLQGLDGFQIKRLAGANRYETNLLILEEAGVANEEILVCTGRAFADSLSASATGKPILLVGKELTEQQLAFLAEHQGNQYFIIGGTGAVSKEIEEIVSNYGTVERIAGTSRYETSVKVAEAFFETPRTAVLASAKNFPDGLCGGPLAMSKNAPLILTATGKEASAAEYTKNKGINVGAVLGGTGLISDEATNTVYGSSEIINW